MVNPIQRSLRPMLVVMVSLLVPSAAYAQAVITGVVKDASGGVLPGATVEAASPVLIEKVRSVVTDANGQYPHRRPAPRHLLGDGRRCRASPPSNAKASSCRGTSWPR